MVLQDLLISSVWQALKELGIVEEIVEEPGEFTVDTMPVVCEELRGKILRFLEKYEKMDGEELVEERYRRFRDMWKEDFDIFWNAWYYDIEKSATDRRLVHIYWFM